MRKYKNVRQILDAIYKLEGIVLVVEDGGSRFSYDQTDKYNSDPYRMSEGLLSGAYEAYFCIEDGVLTLKASGNAWSDSLHYYILGRRNTALVNDAYMRPYEEDAFTERERMYFMNADDDLGFLAFMLQGAKPLQKVIPITKLLQQ